jgi:replicative DNA helicase
MQDLAEQQGGQADTSQMEMPVLIEAEQALLGAILINNDAYHMVAQFLSEEHFSEHVHQIIYRAISKRISEGKAANPMILKAAMMDVANQMVGELTLAQYLVRLAAEAATILNARDYAQSIIANWKQRHLMQAALDCFDNAKSLPVLDDIDTIIEKLSSDLRDIQFSGGMPNVVSIGEAARKSLAETNEAHQNDVLPGYSSGFQPWDHIVGRMRPGDLIVLLAPSGGGKSIMASQIMCSIAEHYVPSMYFQMEMQSVDMARRSLALASGVKTSLQEDGTIDMMDFNLLMKGNDKLQSVPFYIDDSPQLKMSQIEARMRAAVKMYKIGAFAVDHLKLIEPEHWRDNDLITIKRAANRMKALAKELKVPVLLLAQCTRESQKREDTRPRISDIWGGGDIEEIADAVVGLHNPSAMLMERMPNPKMESEFSNWLQEVERWKGRAEMRSMKRRRGKKSEWFQVGFDGEIAEFTEL